LKFNSLKILSNIQNNNIIMIDNEPYITDIGITIAGSVDSGKSTFVGVLTSNELDNGNGSARITVAKHPHEKQSGKTSDISARHFMIPEQKRAVTLFDLCGHEKYFKTTAYGVSGCFPDYSFVVVGANRGILTMTKQHFTLLLSMNIPIIILVTRIDITPKETYELTLKQIDKYCRDIIKLPAEFINNYFNKEHENEEWLSTKLDNLSKSLDLSKTMKQPFVPIISISNKTGYYINFVKTMIKNLNPRNLWESHENNRIYKKFIANMDKKYFNIDKKTNIVSAYYIDGIYNPPGIGMVVTGINRGDDINVGDTVYIGPINREFKEIKIRSIHNDCRQKINYLKNHHRGTIAITGDKDFINKTFVKRGLIIIKNKLIIKTNLCYRFNAGVTIFNHSTTLKNNYTPIIQIGNIRQSARMSIEPENNNNKDTICCKEFAYVTFKFKYKPELIEPYQIFVFRSGNVHGVGVILDILPICDDLEAKPDPEKSRNNFIYRK
jgi:elongation factor 1-alpha